MKTHMVFASLLLVVALLVSFALPGDVAFSMNAPHKYAIKTFNGHYLTAVGGGGRTTDVIHSDATQARSWEIFTLIDMGEGNSQYAIQTANGHYLTAVGGGGRITDVIHSNATQVQSWEKFTLNSLGGGFFTLQTVNGHYLTAVDGGGRTWEVIHSDATKVGSWEKLRFVSQ